MATISRRSKIMNSKPVKMMENVIVILDTKQLVNLHVPPRKPALIPSYDEILSASTIGGGLVSFTTGGSVTGSTPQKSSVNVAVHGKRKIKPISMNVNFNTHMVLTILHLRVDFVGKAT